MEIREIEICPSTQGSTWYVVGKAINVTIEGLRVSDVPVVSGIKFHVSSETYNPIITIEVANETYCIYENVPYCVYYKTSFHQ